MNFYTRRFNLYFWPAALFLLVSGCAAWSPGPLFHHKKAPVAQVRVHVESESSAAGSAKTISVLRSQPVAVNISTDPILTELDVVAARLLEAPGGIAVEIKFEDIAGWRLEQYSAINPGKHLAIFGQWGDTPAEGRWLAAPLMVRRMAGGVLVFTPDASRAEMEQWVKGLSEAAKKNAGVKSKS